MSIERGDVSPLHWATYGDMTDPEIAEYLGEPYRGWNPDGTPTDDDDTETEGEP